MSASLAHLGVEGVTHERDPDADQQAGERAQERGCVAGRATWARSGRSPGSPPSPRSRCRSRAAGGELVGGLGQLPGPSALAISAARCGVGGPPRSPAGSRSPGGAGADVDRGARRQLEALAQRVHHRGRPQDGHVGVEVLRRDDVGARRPCPTSSAFAGEVELRLRGVDRRLGVGQRGGDAGDDQDAPRRRSANGCGGPAGSLATSLRTPRSRDPRPGPGAGTDGGSPVRLTG